MTNAEKDAMVAENVRRLRNRITRKLKTHSAVKNDPTSAYSAGVIEGVLFAVGEMTSFADFLERTEEEVWSDA